MVSVTWPYNGRYWSVETFTFDELVSILNGEDMEMTKDTSDVDTASVMVATHDKNTSTSLQNSVLPVPSTSATGSGPSLSQFMPQTSLGSQFGGASQFFPQSGGASQFSPQFGGSQQFSPQFGGSQFTPQGFPQAQTQFYPNSFRSSNRGRDRGPRFPGDPCDICRKTNHTTNYCYYRPTFQPFDTAQWRGGPSQMPYYPLQFIKDKVSFLHHIRDSFLHLESLLQMFPFLDCKDIQGVIQVQGRFRHILLGKPAVFLGYLHRIMVGIL